MKEINSLPVPCAQHLQHAWLRAQPALPDYKHKASEHPLRRVAPTVHRDN